MSWGEIYNTSWWGVALDTARTVKARPDFFGSQLNLLTSEQPNLVTNGTFDTDSDWILSSNADIQNNLLNLNASGGFVLAQQLLFSSGLYNSKTVKLTYNVTANDLIGNGNLRVGGYSGSSLFPSVINLNKSIGSHTIYITVNSTGSNNVLDLYITGGYTSGKITIDNVSLQVARAELNQIEAKKCLADWIHTTALKDLNN